MKKYTKKANHLETIAQKTEHHFLSIFRICQCVDVHLLLTAIKVNKN